MVNNTLMSFEKYLTYDARPKVVKKGSLVTTVNLSPGLLDNSVTDFYAYSCRYLFIQRSNLRFLITAARNQDLVILNKKGPSNTY